MVAKLEFALSELLNQPLITLEEQRTWKQRIDAQLNACGCNEGSAVFLVFGAALFCVSYFGLLAISIFEPQFWFVFFAGSFASVGLGKWLGKLRGRFVAKQSIYELSQLVAGRKTNIEISGVNEDGPQRVFGR